MSAHSKPSDPPTSAVSSSASKKRKNKHSSSHKTHTVLSLSRPPYTYLHLSLISSISISTTNADDANVLTGQMSIELDALTIRTHLTSALSSFLGMTGSAIPIDILKHSGTISGPNDVWIRVPIEDGSAVVTALGAWMGRGDIEEGRMLGWRVLETGSWLPGMVGGSEGVQSLFYGAKKNSEAG